MTPHKTLHPFAIVPSDLTAGSTLSVLDLGAISAVNTHDPAYLILKATGGGWLTNTSTTDRSAVIRIKEYDESGNAFTKYIPMPGSMTGTYTVPLINGSSSYRTVVDIVADANGSNKSSANANQCKLVGAIRSGYAQESFHIQCRFATTATTGGNGRFIGGGGIPGGTSGVASGACMSVSIALDTTASGGNLNINGYHVAGHTAYGLASFDAEADVTASSAASAAMTLGTMNSTNAPLELGFVLSATETAVKCWIAFDLFGGGA